MMKNSSPPNSNMPSRQTSDFIVPPMRPPSPQDIWARGDTKLWNIDEDDDLVVNSKPSAFGVGRAPGSSGGTIGSTPSPFDGFGRGDVFQAAIAQISPTQPTTHAFPIVSSGGAIGPVGSRPSAATSVASRQPVPQNSLKPDIDQWDATPPLGSQATSSATNSGGRPALNYGALFQSTQPAAMPPRQVPMGGHGSAHYPSSNDVAVTAQKHGEALMNLSRSFPPPPPIVAPAPSRRERAERWYSTVLQWDLTRVLPPPPRNPLPQIAEEQSLGLPPNSKAPYRGEIWLERCEKWFFCTQASFTYNPEVIHEVNITAALPQMAATNGGQGMPALNFMVGVNMIRKYSAHSLDTDVPTA